MTFEDTQVGDLIVITVHVQNKKVSLESKIKNIIDNSLIAEPFMVNKSVLNFQRNMEIEMMVVHPNSTPIYWQKVYVDLKPYHDENCHIITTNLPGIKMNRRSNFRVYIGQNVKVIGIGDQPIQAELKDLSIKNCTLLINKDIEVEVHKRLTLEYLDIKTQKYFELSGRPVRKQEFERYNAYGVILEKGSADLENYLTQKQMENRPNSKKET